MANLKPLQSLNLDANQQKNFIKYFKTLPEKISTTIRFFDRTEFYSLHGDDADFAAKAVFKSTANIKIMAGADDEELRYVVLSKGNFENLVRELLIVKNYRVEVYTSKGGARTNDWSIEYKGSPGNLLQFEELLFSNNEMVNGSALIALLLKNENQQKNIGLAYVEANERIFSVTEFMDDDFFSELEAIVVLLGPKECLIPSAEGDYIRLKDVLERNGIMVTVRKKTEFNFEKSDLVQDLNKLLHFRKGQQESANSLPEINNVLAMSSLGAAIKYLELVNDTTNHGHFEIELLNLNRYVHLDAAAVTALNIFPKPGTSMKSSAFKWQSILGVLDNCQTPQGHRLMAQWVKQPLRNEATIKDRHDIVQCFVDSVTGREDLHNDILRRMPDILMVSKRLMKKRATLQDIYRLYQVVMRIPRLLTVLSELENVSVNNVLYDPIKDTLGDLAMFKSMVEQILDMDEIDKGEYLIKPSFDEELAEFKDKMDGIEEKMNKLLSKSAKDLGLDEGTSIKLDYVSHIGYHFRISLKDDGVLRKNNKYKTIDAIKGGIRFTNDRLSDLNTDFIEAKSAYEEHQKGIVEEVVKIALGYLGPLTCLNNEIAQLDCLVSFAIAAVTAPESYIRPKMHPEGHGLLKLEGVRHPCLELQEDVTYIANNAIFDKDETNMYIITGPNMGGKSTYIRSIGVTVLMAHVGSFVPCARAEISIVDAILGRVGAGDCLMKGLSTFMVEMIETSGIIRTATEKSVVLIDELGRGTSTYDGCGLAWAIAEHLANETKCFTLFATHFHEITELANTSKKVKNCHMDAIADSENFTLLYKVKPGAMEKSFGIQVAKLANFPEKVVAVAQKIYNSTEDHSVQMKANKDVEGMHVYAEAMDIIKGLSEAVDDDKIKKSITEIRNKVKNSNSTYLQQVFPHLFN